MLGSHLVFLSHLYVPCVTEWTTFFFVVFFCLCSHDFLPLKNIFQCQSFYTRRFLPFLFWCRLLLPSSLCVLCSELKNDPLMMDWLEVLPFSEPKPKTCDPEEETAEDKDWSQLGALLLQVGSPLRHFTNSVSLPAFPTGPPVLLNRFQLDHARSNLIWNLKTREELRDALEGEMRAFNVDRELGSSNVISWNHQEFEVCATPQCCRVLSRLLRNSSKSLITLLRSHYLTVFSRLRVALD